MSDVVIATRVSSHIGMHDYCVLHVLYLCASTNNNIEADDENRPHDTKSAALI